MPRGAGRPHESPGRPRGEGWRSGAPRGVTGSVTGSTARWPAVPPPWSAGWRCCVWPSSSRPARCWCGRTPQAPDDRCGDRPAAGVAARRTRPCGWAESPASPLRVVAVGASSPWSLFSYVSTLVSLITACDHREAPGPPPRPLHPVLEDGHTVVLGWSDQIFTVVGRDRGGQRQPGAGEPSPSWPTGTRRTWRRSCVPKWVTQAAPGSSAATSTRRTRPRSNGSARPRRTSSWCYRATNPTRDAEIVKNLLSLRAAGISDDCRARILAVVRDGRYRLAAALRRRPGGRSSWRSTSIAARLGGHSAPGSPGLSTVVPGVAGLRRRRVLRGRGADAGRPHVRRSPDRPIRRRRRSASCVRGGELRLNPAPDSLVRTGGSGSS